MFAKTTTVETFVVRRTAHGFVAFTPAEQMLADKHSAHLKSGIGTVPRSIRVEVRTTKSFGKPDYSLYSYQVV